MRNTIKWILFPGMNLHARERFRLVPEKFGREIGEGTHVLDAGCGNGMLSYRAWQRGANVLGISIKQKEIDSCISLFNKQRGIPSERLQFRNVNLYDMDPKDRLYDAIICTEVLEHIMDDNRICEKFFQLLKPNGVLHVTTPNAEHPYNIAFPIDYNESGGHVRPGYTEAGYRALLEPIGFHVDGIAGLGGPIRQFFDDRIKRTQERFGALAGVPIFAFALPLIRLDAPPHKRPFCLYVRARKPQ
jgi:SAM-dependent methyltransferase